MFTPDPLNLLMLSIPLFFVDWQLAMVWGFSVTNPDLITIFLTLPFGGFEVWFVFLAMGALRLLLFRNR